jgi:hypothetical protein
MTDSLLLRLDAHLKTRGGDGPKRPSLLDELEQERRWAATQVEAMLAGPPDIEAIKERALEKLALGDIHYDGDDVGDLLFWLYEQGLNEREAEELATAIVDELHEGRRWERADYYYDLWKEG